MKDQTIVFRATKDMVKMVDYLAKLIGTTRSEALRRLIPDLRTSAERGRRLRKSNL